MDEREAYDLFTPARERTLPQPRISMAEVYESHTRRHRVHRRLAVAGSLAGVLIIVAGGLMLSRPGDGRRATPGTSSPSSGAPPELGAVLHELPVPPGSVARPVAEASQAMIEVGRTPRTRQQTAYWTSPLSQSQTVSWLTTHLSPTWTGGFNSRVGADDVGQFTWPANAAEYGPNLTISVHAVGSGAAILVNAWEVPLPPKIAQQTLSGVRSVTVSLTADTSTTPFATFTRIGAEAERLATDINALPVNPGFSGGCLAAFPEVDLRFDTDHGLLTFHVDRNCHDVELLHVAGAPALTTNEQLVDDLASMTSASATAGDPAVTVGGTPSFAPTPGTGTLDVGILVVGGPAPGINDPTSAGTITVLQDGTKVGGGRVSEGHRLELHLPAGSYQVQASMGGACPPVTAVAKSGSVTQVEARCDIK